ncbi:DUF1302 domain-containing protein [Salinimonas sediminis]|uniref:DUF1302 domain-containing protein n=1 Tax=Salinimonas sediminis TaxID=2303538 RepID=A0A346NM15_9ALTE|nr:DUF1302 domain-containing protein [Salinimonas sediminis]AXR06572.1 DUF1302 domain-containing protein [Salinimonas sediminis]
MTRRLCAFKKTPVAAGVIALLGIASVPANAANWQIGDASVTLDSTFTLATSIRVEDRDYSLIGNSNHPQFDWTGYNAATNVIYPSADVWALSGDGAYSANGDLGNLANDPGEAFSSQVAGNHELDVNFGDYGFFARGFWFYDFEQENGTTAWANPITGQQRDLCQDADAKDLLCADIRLLDAFFYGDWWIDDKPLTVRIGQQVISWGESTFIQHGINTTNPVDVTRAQAPGAELKEVFIPVGMVYASLGLTQNLSVSGYYQYEWERSWLPVAGSYFATNDFAGEGGQFSNIQLGFTGNPDINLDTLLTQLNALGSALGAGADPAQISQAYLAYPTKVAVRGYSDEAHIDADDQGQFGLRMTWFAEDFYETEFSFYHINYHSQRPLVSGITSDFTAEGIGQDIAYLAQNTITRENITDLVAFTKTQFLYPEDIKLYGMSFNTNVGTTAFAGEFAYRVDEPLQIDDVELLYQAMPEQLAKAGLRPDLAGIAQLKNIGRDVGPGESAEGFLLSDTWQAQFTLSHVFGPMLGSDNFVLLGEAGYVNIVDFPDPEIIRLNAPGTGRTPSLEPTASGNPRTGLHTGLSNGPETNPFATDDAWGYRLLAVADYNNIMAGVNMRMRATFSHDVEGTTPDPLFLFTEDVKSANLSFTFDYLSKWSATASYNAYWGGIGTTNALADRDFISFNIKYSI